MTRHCRCGRYDSAESSVRPSHLLGQVIKKADYPRRKLGIAVVHRVNGLAYRQCFRYQYLHQLTALPVLPRQKIGEANQVSPTQCQLK